MVEIKVATDFYRRPAGRFKSDGRYSGETFREDFLLPKLQQLADNDKLIVDFTDVSMSGSSFLEEAFGGLVRKGYFTVEQLEEKLEIRAESRKVILEKIREYIESAKVE